MAQAIETHKVNGYTVKIYQDEDAESTMTIDATNDAREQAKAQLEGIREMLARLKHAINCDASEPDECELCKDENEPDTQLEIEITRQYTFDELHDEDSARDAIREDALEVQVRSGWTNPSETLEPAEFNILLCTGGPAVRIMGELDNYGNPERAWLEYKDWGTPWVELIESDTMDKRNALLEYASHYLGY